MGGQTSTRQPCGIASDRTSDVPAAKMLYQAVEEISCGLIMQSTS
jgi:hypothetical protein